MDNRSKELISKQFNNLVLKHQCSMESLHSTKSTYTREHQEIKFSYVMKVLKEKDSLLDIGCGLGDLCLYCRNHGWTGRYTGLDISDKMVAFTKDRLKNDEIFEVDILEDNYNDKHDVVVSISTIQQKPLYEDGEIYLKNMIEKMFMLSNKSIIFDVFSNKFVDYVREGNLYVDPINLLNYCYKLSNRLLLINEYNPHQLMMILHKKSSKGWLL